MRFDVKYEVRTGIDGSVVSSNTVQIAAATEGEAATKALDHAYREDPATDERIDPRVVVLEVDEVDEVDET